MRLHLDRLSKNPYIVKLLYEAGYSEGQIPNWGFDRLRGHEKREEEDVRYSKKKLAKDRHREID